MERAHTKFPLHSIAEGMSTPEIKMEGHKVLFDKKVSLMPVDTKKQQNNSDGGSGI
ncbi:hypothetical protein JMN32_04470 [Fulvivirga sp. 29W222]|uniref:Uncharacterized protein n=1 Tax=Fulvivirga marina TaxID=2494733 RepID=A0A937KB72_9BACT|nr:hypothetical protein [Fulvivirga marina]MBL6445549.1 hypothetical protein [Fulvivirga marina]